MSENQRLWDDEKYVGLQREIRLTQVLVVNVMELLVEQDARMQTLIAVVTRVLAESSPEGEDLATQIPVLLGANRQATHARVWAALDRIRVAAGRKAPIGSDEDWEEPL